MSWISTASSSATGSALAALGRWLLDSVGSIMSSLCTFKSQICHVGARNWSLNSACKWFVLGLVGTKLKSICSETGRARSNHIEALAGMLCPSLSILQSSLAVFANTSKT